MVPLDGFPGSSNNKESVFNAGDPGLIPGSGRSPGGGNGCPLQYSSLENFMDREAWRATVCGVAESDMMDQLTHCSSCRRRDVFWSHVLCPAQFRAAKTCKSRPSPGREVDVPERTNVMCWKAWRLFFFYLFKRRASTKAGEQFHTKNYTRAGKISHEQGRGLIPRPRSLDLILWVVGDKWQFSRTRIIVLHFTLLFKKFYSLGAFGLSCSTEAIFVVAGGLQSVWTL